MNYTLYNGFIQNAMYIVDHRQIAKAFFTSNFGFM